MWSKEYLFYNGDEKILTLNVLGIIPRLGDYITLPLCDSSYRVIYLLDEDEPVFSIKTNVLTSVKKLSFFLQKELHPSIGDMMKPGESSYLFIDHEDESDTVVVDLSKDEWDEPTRPRCRVVSSYRSAPTFRELNTGLSAKE